MRLRLYIYRRRVRVTVCIVLLCGVIPRSPSMYNAYPKLCYMFVRVSPLRLTRRRWHWNTLFGCVYGQFQPDL